MIVEKVVDPTELKPASPYKKMLGKRLNEVESGRCRIIEDKSKCCDTPVIIEDRGLRVCKNCGIVQEGLVFEKHENEASLGKDLQHYGAFSAPEDCSQELGTTFKKSEATLRLINAKSRDRAPYSLRIKRQLNSFVKHFIDKFGLRKDLAEDCKRFCLRIWKQKNNKGIDIHAMIVASFYYKLKIEAFFIPIDKITEVCGMEPKKVKNAINRVKRIISNSEPLKNEWNKITDINYALKMLESLYSTMGLDPTVYMNARTILKSKKCRAALKEHGKNNSFGLLAGALYLSIDICKARIKREKILTQHEIAKKLETSVVTLREYFQFLKNVVKEKVAKCKNRCTNSATTTQETNEITPIDGDSTYKTSTNATQNTNESAARTGKKKYKTAINHKTELTKTSKYIEEEVLN